MKTEDGKNKRKIAMYCKVLEVSRQGFYNYLKNKDKPWKYKWVADLMWEILKEDEYNDTYGRYRMHKALVIKYPDKPLEKCVTDITEIKCKDGKLYASAIFDCFDVTVLGLAMDTNMKAPLCVQTLKNAYNAYPGLRGAIIHSDRGTQYTSFEYREAIKLYGINQSMNSDGGRCHDNARCESMWARLKEELFYGRYDTEKMTVAEVKDLVWRYFMSYWNNRRICSSNDGLPPLIKRKRYYESDMDIAA